MTIGELMDTIERLKDLDKKLKKARFALENHPLSDTMRAKLKEEIHIMEFQMATTRQARI